MMSGRRQCECSGTSRWDPSRTDSSPVEAARASPPDLYLFDIDMPRLDGLAAAATLAAEGLRRPVVVVTGVEDPDLIDRSRAASAPT